MRFSLPSMFSTALKLTSGDAENRKAVTTAHRVGQTQNILKNENFRKIEIERRKDAEP